MSTDTVLVKKAAELARRNPHDWKEFIEAFAGYTTARKDFCVQSPVETLQVAQGRAQQCATLLDLLSNAVSLADRANRTAG